MENVSTAVPTPSPRDTVLPTGPVTQNTAMNEPRFNVIRRNGKATSFDATKITIAITKAFLAVEGGTGAASARVRDICANLTQQVVQALSRRAPGGGTVHIEDIQDQVELALMRNGHHEIARSYVLYREERARARAAEQQEAGEPAQPTINVRRADGSTKPLDRKRLKTVIQEACANLTEVNADTVLAQTERNLFDGVAELDVMQSAILSARAMLETEPNYSYVTARLLLDFLRREVLGEEATHAQMTQRYPEYFASFIKKGIAAELLDPRLAEFDLAKLGATLKADRDLQFTYLGLQTLFDRYFLHIEDRRIELPQAFWMRVAMGLSLNEIDRETRAIEFYNVLSTFDFVSSTPTLFNAGSLRSQLSSCYLTTVPDHLDGIYGAIKDNALLSKYAGGLGNDWTPVRALGSRIKGTNGKSQGVVPFLKVANDTAVAVNQCFAPETPVFTADGVKAIRDVKVGDLVLTHRGQYREVLDHMLYNQTDRMVEVSIKHAIAPVRVTAGHPFWALRGVPMEQAQTRTLEWLDKGKVKPDWIDAGELRSGDYVAQVIPKEVVPVADFGEEDARFYGILLGDGRLASDGDEWGVAGNPQSDSHLDFVRAYLSQRGIHFWEVARGETYTQIRWATGTGVVREASSGRFVGAGAPTLPFTRADLYDAAGNKHIARRFAHLPLPQTRALIRGLLETDGGVSRGKEIYFTNTSRALIEGLRYQLLRLAVPCAGQYRERAQTHTGTRANGSQIQFNGVTKAYDLRIPAVAEIAELVGCTPLTKRNWLAIGGHVFTRVKRVREIPTAPFVFDLKVEGDETYMTTSALVHNGGKRKGAVCAYLETWHLDIEEFLELRKNTGDDRRRTHDMNTANWIPDLFMQRVRENGDWTLFSPSDTPDLHDLYGKAFEERYKYYEDKAARGEMKLFKKIRALDLWRKMLSMLFETGHPWFTFKDPCNLRSPQQHKGVVHSSNLCTEITLNTSVDEIAVCNLGSVNLAAHVDDKNGLDFNKLGRTVRTAMRMLDNVIDINYYSVPQARTSNLRHRPVGLGIMAFQDALYKLRVPYSSDAAIEFADASMEAVSYHAIMASTELAKERGTYPSYQGSLWSQGVLPIDSIERVAQARAGWDGALSMDRGTRLDWQPVRAAIAKYGMRNSNTMAIAPTATISNIAGVAQSIEPTYQNLYVKSNLSGEFTVLNEYLVRDLKERGLWDPVMVNDLKYFDGRLGPIDRIPADLKALYATAFEIEPKWLIECAARRQKWIDQAQSLNLYMAQPSGKKLGEMYMFAWERGLKTTYYLRSLGATAAEKSTIADGTLNAVKSDGGHGRGAKANGKQDDAPKACLINDPTCEACQ